jgi:hypothetical protein
MRNGNGNHKPKRYSFPLPLVIRSDSPILITDGKAQLRHKGDIIVRIANTQSVEFETQEPTEKRQEMPSNLVQATIFEPELPLPDGYVKLMTAQTKTTSHGRSKSIYEYYKRERDMSFIAIVRRNEKIRQINLGSLFEPESIMTVALKEFSREKPFYRRDIKPDRMPHSLKQGQRIKSCLDILTHEGFLDRTEVSIGKNRKTDRYVRTVKQLP